MAGRVKVVDVDVDQLEPDPENIRKAYDESVIAGLATFLRNEGRFIEHPVAWQVGEMADGRPRYRAYSGSTRAQAAHRVGGKIAIVVLPEKPDPQSKVRGQLSAAALKKDLSPLEIALALKEIQQGDGGLNLSVRDVKNQLDDVGVKRERSWISNHLRILEAEPSVQEMFAQRELPVDAVGMLLSVKGANQVELAGRIKSGWDWRQARSLTTANAAEVTQQELDERISDVAHDAGHAARGGRTRDRDRRSGPMAKHYALLGVDADTLSHLSRARRGRRRASADLMSAMPQQWLAVAPADQKALAAEVAALRPSYSDEMVIKLVERVMDESDELPEPLMLALNALGRVLSLHVQDANGGLRAYPNATSLMRMRCEAMLDATAAVEKQIEASYK